VSGWNGREGCAEPAPRRQRHRLQPVRDLSAAAGARLFPDAVSEAWSRMEKRLMQMISALRNSGVRVSLAESTESLQAVNIMGIAKRQQLRLSLRCTLIKDTRDLPIFDRLFPLFFGSGEPPAMGGNLGDQLSADEAEMLEVALREFAEQLRPGMERLLSGRPLTQDELEFLGQLTGAAGGADLRYQRWLTQRMLRALSLPEVQNALQELLEHLKLMGMGEARLHQMAKMLDENMQGLREQVSQYAGMRLAENISARPPGPSADDLMDTSFEALSDPDKKTLQREVQRLASALRTRIALRQKRSKAGQLDAKRTIRANLRYHGIPMEVRHRNRIRKPKLVLLCDVSTSMRFCAQLMLNLLFALQGQVRKTEAFAFIDHLEAISDDLTGSNADQAVASVLRRMHPGHYNTDLGWSLAEFHSEHLDALDRRTTLIVLGDGRNNYNDPRTDLFALLSRRSARTIWLNPEPPALWQGDSDMPKYAPLCDRVLKVANARELTSAVDQLLSA
jgi:uncharacterized protein with von Willebrand factor type A (vWA) domain